MFVWVVGLWVVGGGGGGGQGLGMVGVDVSGVWCWVGGWVMGAGWSLNGCRMGLNGAR